MVSRISIHPGDWVYFTVVVRRLALLLAAFWRLGVSSASKTLRFATRDDFPAPYFSISGRRPRRQSSWRLGPPVMPSLSVIHLPYLEGGVLLLRTKILQVGGHITLVMPPLTRGLYLPCLKLLSHHSWKRVVVSC